MKKILQIMQNYALNIKPTPIKNNIPDIIRIYPILSFNNTKPISEANIILDSLIEATNPKGSYFIDQIIIAYALNEIIVANNIRNNSLIFNLNNDFLLVK